MNGKVKRTVLVIIGLLLFFYFVNSVGKVWKDSTNSQWDLKIYYYAGLAHARDLDPYQTENLALVAQKEFVLKFVYLPATLEIFRLLTIFDYHTIQKLWLILKILALLLLIYIWKSDFLSDASLALIVLFTFFGFGGTLFWDIKAGNIALFEQLFIWVAIWAFIKGNDYFFTVFIVLASLFKFTPIVFLLLLLLRRDRKSWILVAGGVGALMFFILLNYILYPKLFTSFLANASTIGERAEYYNYSLLAFWDDIGRKVSSSQGTRKFVMYGMYTLSAASIIVVSINGYLRVMKQSMLRMDIFSIFLFCCTYAVIVPRIKCYSFIIVIPALLYVLIICRADQLKYLLLFLGIIPVATPFYQADVIHILSSYFPLYLTGILWLYLIIKCYEPPGVRREPEDNDVRDALSKI